MKLFIDIAERVVATYLQVFIGLLLVSWQSNVIDISMIQTAAISAVPAALAVIKGYLSTFVGDTDSASATL